MSAAPSNTDLHSLLLRAGGGDDVALDALLRYCGQRLTNLTRHMLNGYPGVRRWAETDDVLQNALVRLMTALRDVQPESPRDFLGLAALQIRRELLDLVRRYYGPEGIGTRHDSRAADSSAWQPEASSDTRQEPLSLLQWAELHEAIDALPEEEREVVGMLFYQGLAQAEAAAVLNVSVRTVQRRWHAALWKLHRQWNNHDAE